MSVYNDIYFSVSLTHSNSSTLQQENSVNKNIYTNIQGHLKYVHVSRTRKMHPLVNILTMITESIYVLKIWPKHFSQCNSTVVFYIANIHLNCVLILLSQPYYCAVMYQCFKYQHQISFPILNHLNIYIQSLKYIHSISQIDTFKLVLHNIINKQDKSLFQI